MNFGSIWSTRLPQYEYEESSQNQLYLEEYAYTGFLQIMLSATTRLLTDVYKQKPNIQFVYMPFDSKPFKNDNFAETLGALIPVAIYTFIGLARRIIAVTAGDNEIKVQSLLERIGMRKSVTITLEVMLMFLMAPLILLVCWIAQVQLLTTTSFCFIFVNVLLYALNTISQHMFIRFAIESHALTEVVEIVLEIL